jgi:hypothetical protein
MKPSTGRLARGLDVENPLNAILVGATHTYNRHYIHTAKEPTHTKKSYFVCVWPKLDAMAI